MNSVLKDIPRVRAYQDDILRDGITRDEHDIRLREVRAQLARYNLIPCMEKSVFGVYF
jgi:hypothetical protein